MSRASLALAVAELTDRDEFEGLNLDQFAEVWLDWGELPNGVKFTHTRSAGLRWSKSKCRVYAFKNRGEWVYTHQAKEARESKAKRLTSLEQLQGLVGGLA